MGSLAGKLAVMLTLPVLVFWGGVWVMSILSDRPCVVRRPDQLPAPEDRKPLNQRFGYDVGEVTRHWGALDDAAFGAEQRFLELDLVFPFLYGAALATSLLIGWATLGRPFHPAWLLAPVAVTMLADWTENLVQLGQLQHYREGGGAALQAGWIPVASTATILKLLFFYGSSLFILVLMGVMVVRARRAA